MFTRPTQPPREHRTGPGHENPQRKGSAAALARYGWLLVVLFVAPMILYGWERGYWALPEIKAVGFSVALSVVAVVAFELRQLRDQRERWYASTVQELASLRRCIVSCSARIETALYETRRTGIPADEEPTPAGEGGEDGKDEEPAASRDGLAGCLRLKLDEP